MPLFLAAGTGLVVAEQDGPIWRVTRRGLVEHHVTSVIAREGVILAGTTRGVFRSDDDGRSWSAASHGLDIPHVRWLAFHPDISDCEFAGTEPAALFVSHDGGHRWQERLEVASLRDQYGWWLPYSPAAGCVRGFAFHGQRAYAAVEVGGVLRSDDGGQTWNLAAGSNGRPQFGLPPHKMVHADVHTVTVHPTSADLLFAPTGGGFFGSTDGGDKWQTLYANCYVRAVWVDPTNPARMILSPAENASGQNGCLEVTDDGGQTWRKTAVSWSRNIVERFQTLGKNHLFAVLANGELLQTALPGNQSDLSTLTWTQILSEVPQINAVTMMAD